MRTAKVERQLAPLHAGTPQPRLGSSSLPKDSPDVIEAVCVTCHRTIWRYTQDFEWRHRR